MTLRSDAPAPPVAPLPVIVVSGYLGAGKTTLINRMLHQAQGQRIMVLVNDFGSINIDANLLQSADEDTLTLTNGCVCCTMGADLFMALGDALDRRPRPDILVIEASGIADPRRIADAAKAEPELRYGGIVTVVDALNFQTADADFQIGAQVRDQIKGADILLVSKCDHLDPLLVARLLQLSPARCLRVDDARLNEMLLSDPLDPPRARGRHPQYAQWTFVGASQITLEDLRNRLAKPPPGAFRIKGFVQTVDMGGWEVHLVGQTVDLRPSEALVETTLVAIGAKSDFQPEQAEIWWRSAL